MFLVYHVTSKSHVIKESNDHRLEHIKVSYHSAKFSGRKHSGIRNIMYFDRHVTSKDHLI